MAAREINSESYSRASLPNLDLAKFLMALLVVEIHTNPFMVGQPGPATSIVRGIDCVAVPFFFIASGFLCFRRVSLGELGESGSASSLRVRGTMARQLRMYLAWTVVYLPVTVWADIDSGNGILKSALLFVRGALLVGENQYSWPLWYLLASVVAFALVYLMLRGGVPLMRVFIASAVALLAGFVLSLLHKWGGAPAAIALPVKAYYLAFGNVRNGLFEGFFYVALGAVLGTEGEGLERVPLAGAVAGAVAGLAGCVLISSDAHLPFCALFAVSVFLLSVRRRGPATRAHAGMRRASTVTYLVHMLFAVLFAYAICGCADRALITTPDLNHPAMYAFALGGSLALSALVGRLAGRVRMVELLFAGKEPR